jgi:DNA polymerase-3 subunit delta
LQQAAVYIDIPLVERPQLPNWLQQRSPCSNSLQTGRVWISLLIASRAICLLRIRKYKNSLVASGKTAALNRCTTVLNVARYDVFKLNEAMLAAMLRGWCGCWKV